MPSTQDTEARRASSRKLRKDVDELAPAAGAEGHGAIGGREQRVVATAADVLAGVEASATLAHEDRAGAHGLTGVGLHAEALRGGVPPIAGGSGALLLRHRANPLSTTA